MRLRFGPLFRAAAALALVSAGAFAAEPAHPSRTYTIDQFLATAAITGASFSSDETKILFSSNKTGIYNVYSVSVAGGAPRALTNSATDSTYAVSYFPADDRFLFTRDQAGNELNHLFVREKDGSDRDLTPGEKLKAAFKGWRHAGDAFYVQTNERDPRYFDLYRYDAKTYERTLLFKDETGYQVGDVSEDGRWIALAKPVTTSDADLYLWNTATKEMKNISKHDGVAEFGPQEFDPSSKWLYYTANEGSDFKSLHRYELASGRSEEVEKPEWDVTFASFSRGGRYRVTGTNVDGRTVIHMRDNTTNRNVYLPALPAGEISSIRFSRSEKRLAFQLDGDRGPNNLYVWQMGAPAIKRLTDTMNPEIDPKDLVASTVVRFESFDGMSIPAIFYKPQQASAEARVPALVWVHGGPGGQTRRQFSASIQYLVNHGYAVLAVNNRGSSGYGKSFHTADDQRHGKEPLWDCVAGKKYLQGLRWVDPGRIGIIGGSYGGYMVLAAEAYKPEEFAVGVDLFGVSNWIRTLESIPKWWESQRRALYQEIGNPETQKEMLRQISPLFQADQIRRPLLVLQGANDPRVLKSESDDIVAAVRKNGVPVEYVVFPDEGHGFTKTRNLSEGWAKVLEFLEKYLKNGAPAGEAGG
jgi:dipeptidyl aminopeptidase/acylaminoacyl peptidase